LGGYVKMKGELINVTKTNDKNLLDKDTFLQANLFSRFLIVLSGPLANLILGLLLITSLYYFNGRYVSPPIINEVLDTKPAKMAGIITGDKVISINNAKIKNFSDIKNIVEKNPKNNLLFEILRNENVFYINIVPDEFYEINSKKVLGRIGVTAAPSELITLSILPALKFGVLDSMNMTFEWLKGLKALLSFEVDKKDVLGPIGIAKISGSSLDKGITSIVFLMAILSINLGLINLLPIPALDGGYILLFTYELIFRKPLSGSIQLFLLKFGFLFLISLMILVTAFDLGF
jgi:regulator of sigma E protease